MRLLYKVLLWLLLPYILLRLLWRARKQPEYLSHVGERFGFYPQHDGKPLIWLHAVSVGETRATQSLVARLRAAHPDHRILLTHATPTGRSTGEQLYGDHVLRAYLPYDYPFSVSRFLRHFDPQLGILMETEIWPNLIRAAHEQGVPLLLLNARMSEKSARGYARFAGLTRNALEQLSAVAAQTDDDAARLTALGARNVSVMGNLKFDIEAPSVMLTLGRWLRMQFGAGRKVFLAASTREGEEALLLDALSPYLAGADWLLVIVPRHPQRFAEVAAMLEQRGIAYQRRSEDLAVDPSIRVVLGDSMGEMFAYYAAADLAFIGGSLQPCGGQNLIEACAVGTPVLVGPHTYNFAEATRLAVAAGAACQVRDADRLVAEVQRLLGDENALSAMRQGCAGFVAANRGATDAALNIVSSFLSE
ncbi:MAG: 3-deoxy-D-manno-octulosonic acid transferase [Gallionellales bacterium GWA2_59_43]|nr:MAG: 3-deoxy-D-manno-octulosonic acid transferase [Gallionellales bacterium GWA2_59_43]